MCEDKDTQASAGALRFLRMVEAAGVELITMLTARKLLIPGSATRAKKAPLPVNRQTKFSEEVLWQVRQAI